jgi:hypothetical protein
MRASPALAVTLLALAPASAGAAPLDDYLADGLTFWHARGVPARADALIQAVAAPCALDIADACLPDGLGTRTIQIRASLIRDAGRERYHLHAGGDSARLTLCATVYHELGHTAGLPDTDTGLMDSQGSTVPWPCRVWLRARVRTERAVARAAHRRAHHRGPARAR